jgi:hypothetical protein
MPQMGFELGLAMEESRNGPVELAADFVNEEIHALLNLRAEIWRLVMHTEKMRACPRQRPCRGHAQGAGKHASACVLAGEGSST